MQGNMPDFKKYFPNCEAAQREVLTKRMKADGSTVRRSSSQGGIDYCVAASNERFTVPVVPPAPPPSHERLANTSPATPNAPSKRGLICFCAAGWIIAALGYFLWLFR